MEEKEPKVGDYLWRISYWSDGREIWKCKIKKVNRKSYTSFAGHLYPKSELGVEFFASKEEAIQDKIDLHEEKVRDSKMDVEEYEKEIRALKRIKERLLERR